MEEMDNFERLLKERLEGNETPISDRVWKNIQSSLPVEEKKRFFKPYHYLALLGLVTLVSGLFYFSKDSILVSTNSTIAKKESMGPEVLTSETATTNSSSSESSKISDNQNNSAIYSEESNQLNKNASPSNMQGEDVGQKDFNRTNSTLVNDKGSRNKSASQTSSEEKKISESSANRKSRNSLVAENNVIQGVSKRVNGDNEKKGFSESKRDLAKVTNYKNKKSHVGTNQTIANSEGRNLEVRSNESVVKNTSSNSQSSNNEAKYAMNRNSEVKSGSPGEKSKENSASEMVKENTSSSNINKNVAYGGKNTDEQEQYNNKNSESNTSQMNDTKTEQSVSGKVAVNKGINSSNTNNNKHESDLSSDSRDKIESANNSNENGGTSSNGVNSSNSIGAKAPSNVLVRKDDEAKKDSIERENNSKEKESIEAQKKKKKTKEFSMPTMRMEVFLTPTLSKSNLSGSAGQIEEGVADEKPKIALGTGVRLKFDISEKLRAGLGVSYSSYGDRSVLKTSTDKELLYVNYNIFQDTSGAWVYEPNDTIKFTKSISKKQVVKNSFKYISIPVLLGYQLVDGKFGLSITGGITANILTHAETNTFFKNSSSSVIVKSESSNGNNSPFRPLVFSVFVSPGLSYKVNDRLRIIADPGFTWFLNSVYKSGYAVNRRILALEFRTGVQFTLGK